MMRQDSRSFRLSTTLALGALLCNAALPVAATAQPAPPPAAQPDQNQGDPPSRVGRLSGLSGTVSYRTSADTQWSSASANYPVASGNAFWTEPSATADLEVSASRVVLAPQTEFDVTALDASGLQAVASQGEAYLRLRDLAPNEAWSVQTPRGLVRLAAAGRYGVVAGTTDQPTQVTVLDGAAEIEGPGVSLRIAAGETATITGTDPFQGSVGPAIRDAFLTARLTAERPPRTASVPAPVAAQVYAMPGGEDLTNYGNWSQVPEYGQVWYPPVSRDWVPYRHGHWAYVAPWGWTWVDDAPWGFAPFHYGRWVEVNDRWGWTPGEREVAGPPVYAPALVTFLAVGAGVAVGVGLGAALAGGSVGWVPLGPQEAYHPWYHASDSYVRRVNVSNVANTTNVSNVRNVTNVTNVSNYVNRGAATSVPASIMTGSRPVQAAARPVTPQQFTALRPVVGQQPIRPAATTVGVTPAVARQLNLPPTSAAPLRYAPGPVVRAQAVGPASATPERAASRPPLIGSPGQQPGVPSRGPAAVPGPPAPSAAAPQPGHPPPLVTSGARPAGVATPAPVRPPGAVQTTPPAPAQTPPAGAPAPGIRPESVARPAAVPAPGARPLGTARPVAAPNVARPASVPHPTAPAPEVHAVAPAPVASPAAPRAAPAQAPHVEAPRTPPPRVEAVQPPPPRLEAPRPAPPPPRAAPPAPLPLRAAPPPPPRAAPPPTPSAAPAGRIKRPGEP